MKRTTVYLADDLKAALERVVSEEQRSEAELIREAIRTAVSRRSTQRPGSRSATTSSGGLVATPFQ